MTYPQVRKQIRTGDVALVKGLRSVRVLTGESLSHVAVFAWLQNGGLWVFEFVEGVGYQSMPASQWFAKRKGQLIYWGEAPQIVRANEFDVIDAATSYRHKKPIKRWYGWLSLVTVFFSQLLGRRFPVWLRVCSTFVQEVWEAAGYNEFKRTADPGDFIEHCERLTILEDA